MSSQSYLIIPILLKLLYLTSGTLALVPIRSTCLCTALGTILALHNRIPRGGSCAFRRLYCTSVLTHQIPFCVVGLLIGILDDKGPPTYTEFRQAPLPYNQNYGPAVAARLSPSLLVPIEAAQSGIFQSNINRQSPGPRPGIAPISRQDTDRPTLLIVTQSLLAVIRAVVLWYGLQDNTRPTHRNPPQPKQLISTIIFVCASKSLRYSSIPHPQYHTQNNTDFLHVAFIYFKLHRSRSNCAFRNPFHASAAVIGQSPAHCITLKAHSPRHRHGA